MHFPSSRLYTSLPSRMVNSRLSLSCHSFATCQFDDQLQLCTVEVCQAVAMHVCVHVVCLCAHPSSMGQLFEAIEVWWLFVCQPMVHATTTHALMIHVRECGYVRV